jgi:hypothetical protein
MKVDEGSEYEDLTSIQPFRSLFAIENTLETYKLKRAKQLLQVDMISVRLNLI